MVPPSTTQPPGNLTNPGFKSASICARSGRNPWPLKVFSGSTDTISSHTFPFDPVVRTNLAFGSLRVAVSVAVNFFQCDPMPFIFSGLLHAEPSALSKTAVNDPLNPSAQCAQNDKLYRSPCATPMPQKPSLATPNRPEPASSISNRSERGVAALNGFPMSRCIEP